MVEPQSGVLRSLAINNGPGDFYVAENQHIYQGLVLTSSPVPADYLDAAREAFAPVDKLDEARKALTQGPLAVLVGEHHTGRRTAATHLLQKTSADLSTGMQSTNVRQVHEFTLDWPSPDTRLLAFAQGVDHILDLSDEDEEINPGFVRALAALTSTLTHRQARLVVLVTEELWSDPSGAVAPTFRLGRPNAREVLSRHVQLLTTDETRRRSILQTPISDAVTGLTRPAEAVELARIAATAHGPEQLNKEVERVTSWPSFLRTHLDQQPGEARDRDAVADTKLLLVAAAVCEGHSTGAVYSAYDLLLENIGIPHDPFRALIAPGFTRRLELLEANVNADRVSLTAVRPGVGTAVLRHFWREFPPLREQVLSWLGKVIGLPGWDTKSVTRVAALLVAMAVEAGCTLVLDAAGKWSNGNKRQQELAFAILTAGLKEDDLRSSTLAELRDWAKSSSSSQQQLVAKMCRGGVIHPQRALIRLKWILDAPADANSAREAGESLRMLASESINATGIVLTAIQSWMLRWPAAAERGFIHLLATAEGVNLAEKLLEHADTEPALREALVACWTQAWASPHVGDDIVEGLSVWGSAIDNGPLDSRAEDLLVEALTRHLRATKSLEAVVASPGRPGPGRNTAHFRIIRRAIDAFLGGSNPPPENQAIVEHNHALPSHMADD
ncbi:hypothetical protein [Saccharopolyspora sp. NPDC002376]